ncbi:MAG: excisionase family DNA-binding protein [Actinomycetota bacterium]|nr:excisionase family DNA-binding protein [Actinomycetota bacterium]
MSDTQQTSAVERLAYSPSEACSAIGVGRTFLYSLLDSGQLASIRVGRRRLIPREALDRLLASGGDAA